MHFFRFAIVCVVMLGFGLTESALAKQVEVIISKLGQKMTVKVDGSIKYVWPVSTGAPGYETPSGTFRPFRMEEEHFSKEWDDAPMPNSIFFTDRGHAIHGSYYVKSLGRRASHGCVRLSPENAKVLFDLVESAGMSNTRIILKGGFFDVAYTIGSGDLRRPTPWWLKSNTNKRKRSFAEVGDDIDRTVNKKRAPITFASLFGARKVKKVIKTPDKKGAKVVASSKVQDKPKKIAALAKKPEEKPKKVAEKCIVKDGKKLCQKVPVPKVAKSS